MISYILIAYILYLLLFFPSLSFFPFYIPAFDELSEGEDEEDWLFDDDIYSCNSYLFCTLYYIILYYITHE